MAADKTKLNLTTSFRPASAPREHFRAEDGRIMRTFTKIAIAVAFVSAIVWFGHHSHPHNYGYAALHDAGW